MKPLLLIVIGSAALLSGCGNITPGSPDPLDLPSADWHSPAWGTFGPGGASVPYRAELSTP